MEIGPIVLAPLLSTGTNQITPSVQEKQNMGYLAR